MIVNLNFQITDEKRAAYLCTSAYARGRQNDLIPNARTQNLPWTIIFIVAEACWSDRTVFVTDACYAVRALKSTVIRAIDRLVKDKIIVRKPDKMDRRRKVLSLSPTFKPKLQSYIDEIISRFMLANVIGQIGEDGAFSPGQAEQLLSSLRDAPIPIMIHADDGEVLMISKNWERLTGYKHHEIPTIEKWTKKAYGKNNTVSNVRKDISALYKISSFKDEGIYVVHAKDGKPLTWRFRSSPLGRLSDGRANIISIATDVT